MQYMYPLARMLIVTGLLLVAAGLLFIFLPRIPLLGRLPGDIVVHRRGMTIVLPLASAILISLAVTLLLNLFLRR